MPTTPYTWALLVVGIVVVLAGSALALYVVARPAGRRRKLSARRPELGPVPVAAGRVYASRAAAGAVNARDRVVASPVMEAGATTYLARPAWANPAGRHRMVGAGR